MLVDSSVWIAFLRGEQVPEVNLLSRALRVAAPVWIAPIILQEILQGAENAQRFAKWEKIFERLPVRTEPDALAAARAAAHLYTRCRWAGITPRSANDCMIAIHAINGHMPLLHRDRDFELIASVEPALHLVAADAE